MLAVQENPPSWHSLTRLKLIRLQAEAEAAIDNTKAIEREAGTLNKRLIDLRPMLRTAEDYRETLARAAIPATDPRTVRAQQAIEAIRAEIGATSEALEGSRLRYAASSELSNARVRLAYDAKQALRAVGVMGVN